MCFGPVVKYSAAARERLRTRTRNALSGERVDISSSKTYTKEGGEGAAVNWKGGKLLMVLGEPGVMRVGLQVSHNGPRVDI